jgi:integrase
MPHWTKGGLQPTRHPKFPNPPQILNILAQMKNNAQSDYSIEFVDKSLTHISQHADLNQPEQVKTFIANKNVSNGYKKNLSIAYNKYCTHYQIAWNMPLYKPEAKTIKIPTSAKLDMIIAKAGRILATKLQTSKETGLRPIELQNLKVKDIDIEQKTIYPTTAKHGSARKLKISNNLTTMIQSHINRYKLNPNDKLFKGTVENYGQHYRNARDNLAKKLNDQSIKNIRLYDFRHYYATDLYNKTRDILYVKQQMGHRRIETTLIYTQLLNITEDEEYTVKTANNVKEATELLEAGFTYITDMDSMKLFRKRR